MMTIIAVSGCALRQKQEMQFVFFSVGFVFPESFVLYNWVVLHPPPLVQCGGKFRLFAKRRSHYNKEEEVERDCRRKGGTGRCFFCRRGVNFEPLQSTQFHV